MSNYEPEQLSRSRKLVTYQTIPMLNSQFLQQPSYLRIKKENFKNKYTPHSRNYGDTFQYNNQKRLNKSLQTKPTKT